MAYDSSVLINPNSSYPGSLANDGNKISCSKTKGPIVTFQVDLKEESIVTGVYILFGGKLVKQSIFDFITELTMLNRSATKKTNMRQHGVLTRIEQQAIKKVLKMTSVKPFKRINQRSNLYKNENRETLMNRINKRLLLNIRLLN